MEERSVQIFISYERTLSSQKKNDWWGAWRPFPPEIFDQPTCHIIYSHGQTIS